MLEVINITKKYKPKKGPVVNALDGVSIKFPEKGLVFILGKSGSGKSTLLNVLGGLDKVDSGEIIIKGKSSAHFSQSDFDSYRNTYLGFIFQEYNILNEFTVGENIALAIQLQGRKAKQNDVNKILEEVDLANYAKRKPNELSGGQKQRVAIARALIKNPEIILADEPTGALDSKTGIQVFDTLKKLAENKLVIVVSHDREFAEYYGDRVIELKDGKVISDIEKHKEGASKTKSGLFNIDNKLFALEQGHILTKEDIETINSALQSSSAFISIDNQTNKEFKKVARLDDNLNREAFKDTDESKIKYSDKSEFKPIKSSLPIRNAFKIGASALKTKPFRLFLTILLSFCAFGMFGLVDTMSTYSATDTVLDGLSKLDNTSYQLTKERKVTYSTSSYWNTDTFNQFSDEEISSIETNYGVKAKGINANYNQCISLSENLLNPANNSLFADGYFGETYLSNEELSQLNFSMLAGNLPSNDNQVAIGDYIYYLFKTYGYQYRDYSGENQDTIEIESNNITPENLIGKKINVRTKNYRNISLEISGIVNTNLDMSEFDSLKNANYSQTYNDTTIKNLYNRLTSEVVYNFPNLLYTSKNYMDNLTSGNADFISTSNLKEGTNYQLEFTNEDETNHISASSMTTVDNASKNGLNITFFDENKSSLTEDEIIISSDSYNNFANIYNITLQEEDSYYNYYSPEYNYYEDGSNNFEITITSTQNQYSDFSSLYYDVFQGRPLYVFYEWALNNLPTSEDFERFAYEYFSSATGWDENTNQNIWTKPKNLSPEAKAYAYAQLLAGTDYNIYSEIFDIQSDKYSQETIDLIGDFVYKAYQDYVFLDDPFTGIDTNTILKAKQNEISKKYLSEITIKGRINLYNYNIDEDNGYLEEFSSYKVVGTYETDDKEDYDKSNCVIVNDNLFNSFTKYISDGYNIVLVDTLGNQDSLRKLVEETYKETGDTRYYLNNSVSDSIEMFNSMISMLTDILFYVGLGFAVFAALLLMNFISISITNKKQEIGILRAVGAKASDVFKIFFSEAFIIAIINFVLALAATIVGTYFINRELVNAIGSMGNFFAFGIRQIGLLLGLSILVAFVSSFLPVYLIAKKKPVDAIRSVN